MEKLLILTNKLIMVTSIKMTIQIILYALLIKFETFEKVFKM